MGKKYLLIALVLGIVFISGCATKQPAATSSVLVCNVPYIQVGAECCLDENGNGVCDKDETTTTAKAQETTVKVTTSVATTSSSSTLTTTIKTACSTSADCGDPQYGNTLCDGNKVMRQVTKFRCSKPGTSNAKCIGSVSTERVTTCDDPNRCVGGKCVTESGDPIAATTSSLACSWTQSECTNYCQTTCTSRGMDLELCFYDQATCTCRANCKGAAATTITPATTTSAPATTTTTSTPGTTTTTISACDCSTLSGGWSNSVSCDGAHEEIEMHATCSGCARCNEVCPEDVGGVDYYLLDGCGGNCYSDLCRLVENAEPQSQYKDCYKCYEPECGNGVIESGEQCEFDADCPGYGYCDLDCGCQPDCPSYCGDQGVDGYQWINDGLGGSPNIGSQAACSTWANDKLTAISQVCFTSCVGSASYSYNGAYSCCCVDWNSLPCQDCPGQNPVCPTEADCMATL